MWACVCACACPRARARARVRVRVRVNSCAWPSQVRPEWKPWDCAALEEEHAARRTGSTTPKAMHRGRQDLEGSGGEEGGSGGGGGGGGGVGASCWKAYIKPQLPDAELVPDFTFNQLFLPPPPAPRRLQSQPRASSAWLFGTRGVRARHPNGDPEATGLHTSPTGTHELLMMCD